MDWTQLLSGKRFGMEEYHERKHERTDFQRDYDRLIFSSQITEQNAGVPFTGKHFCTQPFDTQP